MSYETGLRKTREALGRALLGTRAQPMGGSRFGTGVVTKVAATAIVLGAAATLSSLLGTRAPGFAGAIFFPAILFCTLFAGWLYGVVAWAGSVLAVWLILKQPLTGNTALLDLAIFAAAGGIETAIAAFARAMLFDGELLRHRLLTLVDASQEFMFVTDARGQPIGPHPRWASLTGMDWKEYREQGWIGAIHPDDRGQFPLKGLPSDGTSFQVELRIRSGKDGDWRWYSLRTLPVLDQNGKVREWVGTLRDIHDRKIESQRRELVFSELRHRLKNLMAIVEALAKYSAPRPGTDAGVDAFLRRFSGRLHALTAASDQLIAGHQNAIETSAVIRATLEPFMGDLAPRIRIEGPELLLGEQLGGGLALAVHELATNAIKYGALSTPQGSVSLVWSTEQTFEGERVVFDWKERGGPAPVPPAKDGFGMRMIKAVTSRENIGAVTVDFEPDGLHCRISFTRATAKTSEE